jgi:hypothetical protein
MRVRAVIVLEDAAEDLEAGRNFYDGREPGVGRYFLDCLLSDLESLRLYAGIHSVHWDFTGCCRGDFRSRFTTM